MEAGWTDGGRACRARCSPCSLDQVSREGRLDYVGGVAEGHTHDDDAAGVDLCPMPGHVRQESVAQRTADRIGMGWEARRALWKKRSSTVSQNK